MQVPLISIGFTEGMKMSQRPECTICTFLYIQVFGTSSKCNKKSRPEEKTSRKIRETKAVRMKDEDIPKT